MPARLVAGQPVGGYTNAFEIVCCDCGDDPDLDYRDVSPELQRIRGPYRPIAAGTAAYGEHVALHRPGRTAATPRPRAEAMSIHPWAGDPPQAGAMVSWPYGGDLR